MYALRANWVALTLRCGERRQIGARVSERQEFFNRALRSLGGNQLNGTNKSARTNQLPRDIEICL